MLAMRALHSRDPVMSTILLLIEQKPGIYIEFFVSVRTPDCTGHDDRFQANASLS